MSAGWKVGRRLRLKAGHSTLRAMSSPVVSAERQAQLTQRMLALGVSEADLEEIFVRSGGHGGQNVNKTSTCVMLTHRPTGVQVKCQTTRHQAQNRFLARRLLLDKLEQQRRRQAALETARREKVRRQTRRRSRGAQEKILAEKAHRGARKESRRRVRVDD
jgi:protein subunit release factor B